MMSKDVHPLDWYIKLLWLALKEYPEFQELYSKNNQLVVTFNVYNGMNWCALNHSFQFDGLSSYQDWTKHWFKGLHSLLDTGYGIDYILGLEFIHQKPPREGGKEY
jgi:hypothetical protein